MVVVATASTVVFESDVDVAVEAIVVVSAAVIVRVELLSSILLTAVNSSSSLDVRCEAFRSLADDGDV